MSATTPTLDDIDAHVHNLAQLLDTLVDNLLNVSCPADRGDLSRASALSIIARDMSQSIGRDIEACHAAPAGGAA
jgi:hypothetical protein